MANTYSQEIHNINIVNVPHIDPSIREGFFGNPSILGRGSAIRLERYAPVNLVPPSILGGDKIPDVLTCNPGVWDAAPQPFYLYQWKADGVDIPGANGITFLTYESLDEQEITCEVTAYNTEGSISLESNGIVVEIILPINVLEFSRYVITGLPNIESQSVTSFEVMMVSGITLPTDLDVRLFDTYIVESSHVEGFNYVSLFEMYVVEEETS